MIDRPPFRRVLVANRGEIALRIVRACRELGIESVAIYSAADSGALHVRAADRGVLIGPSAAAESYLRGDRIIDAAVTTGADAIHPGYGFLSEQAPFAAACAAAGITFVGPSPETLASLGDKLAARRAAAAVGVPITPGTLEPLQVEDSGASAIRLLAIARDIGYPLLVKAAAGGGGRGMRRVDEPSALRAAVNAASREAKASFGDGSVYLERYVEGARHIEVQLLGDASGAVVALGERDCSTQRRHQKLLEEAPAPGLSSEHRKKLHAVAVSVAVSVGLQNAATAEFLMDRDGEFSFLEVNARLQVEHGVTEMVAEVDLVQEQLHIAGGRSLGASVMKAAARAADPPRHAIEARISAEDPSRDFLPSPGRITRWSESGGPGVRVDSGVEVGTSVSPEYDPLLAKLMVVAPTRGEAIIRLARALDEWRTGGVQTTIPFHRWLLRHPAFVAADLRTDLVDRDWKPGPLREAAARTAAHLVAASLARDGGTRALEAEMDETASLHAQAEPLWAVTARREATERW